MMRSIVLRRVAAASQSAIVGNNTNNSKLFLSSSVRFLSSSTASLPDVTLYQYHICPFCHKTKAVMGYAGIEPTVIEVNPLNKAELPKGDYRKVPIALIDGEQVNGSDAIVNSLLQNPQVKETILSKSTSLKDWDEFTTASSSWVTFANDDLAALLYPNICSSIGDSYTAFGYVRNVDSFSALQKLSIRGIGSLAMYMAASRIKAKRGIDDERAALQEALQKWQTEGLGTKQFASGKDDPNLGDLAVFGTLRSVEGLPTHDEMVLQDPNNVVLKEWYLRMKDRVGGY